MDGQAFVHRASSAPVGNPNSAAIEPTRTFEHPFPNPVRIVTGDIFTAAWDAFVHCCNTFRCMGGGIALAVARKFPQAADIDRLHGGKTMLGKFTSVRVEMNGREATIYNLYAQIGMGNDGDPSRRNVQYDLLYDGLRLIVADIRLHHDDRPFRIALPWIGCGLAGGDRRAVFGIVSAVAAENVRHGIEFTIYQVD